LNSLLSIFPVIQCFLLCGTLFDGEGESLKLKIMGRWSDPMSLPSFHFVNLFLIFWLISIMSGELSFLVALFC
jgi:hypothetical protein